MSIDASTQSTIESLGMLHKGCEHLCSCVFHTTLDFFFASRPTDHHSGSHTSTRYRENTTRHCVGDINSSHHRMYPTRTPYPDIRPGVFVSQRHSCRGDARRSTRHLSQHRHCTESRRPRNAPRAATTSGNVDSDLHRGTPVITRDRRISRQVIQVRIYIDPTLHRRSMSDDCTGSMTYLPVELNPKGSSLCHTTPRRQESELQRSCPSIRYV